MPTLVPRPSIGPHPDSPPESQTQAGCFSRSQARAVGIADHRQRRLIASGLWVPVTSGVFRTASLQPTAWMRAHAALLASGLSRAVSHSTAAALWGWPIDDELHVIRRGGRTHAAIREHRVVLSLQEVNQAFGVRFTTLPRTVADVLTGFDHDVAVAALAEGFRRGLFTAADVASAAATTRGRSGAGQARALADSCRGGPYSLLEWEFHQVAWAVDPDGWQFNVPIRDYGGLIGVVDALHVPTGTVVEVDGRAYHGDRFQADRTRDQRLAALGLLCVRVTHSDLRSPMMVADRLRRILATRAR